MDDGLRGRSSIREPSMEGPQRDAKLRGDLRGRRKPVRAVQTGDTDPSYEVRFTGMLGQHRITDLLANLGGDRIGVRTWKIQNLGVEVPFHPICIKVYAAVEQ